MCDQFSCAFLRRGLLLQGQLFIFERFVCFHSKLFGVVTTLRIPLQARPTRTRGVAACCRPTLAWPARPRR